MLKERLLTGLFAGTVVLAGLLFLNTMGTALMLGAVTLVGAFEWGLLMGADRKRALAFAALVALAEAASLFVPARVVGALALVWWVWAAIEVFVFRDRPTFVWRHRTMLGLAGLLILVPTWRGCVALKLANPTHPALLIGVLVLVWTADSAAYFGGRALGRRKLAPLVSPGKSVEGAAVGMMACSLASVLGSIWLGYPVATIAGAALLGVAVAAISVVGDLLESKAKRLAGVKDSGHWLPGHGGILDRIDAVTAAVPLFVLSVRYLGVR